MPDEPNFLIHVLFEAPLGPAIALFIFTAALALIALRTGRAKIMVVAALPGALGITLFLLAAFVQTPRERLIERTTAFIAAAGPWDSPQLQTFFAPTAILTGPDRQTWLSLADALDAGRNLHDRFGFEPHRVNVLGASIRPDGWARSAVDLTTRFSRGPFAQRPIATRWAIRWIPHADTWRIAEINWLEHPNGLKPQHGIWNQ